MQSLVNFRDLGGIITEDGRKIAPHRLLRSGEPVKIDEQDKIELLQKYKLKTIVDLRSEREAELSPVDFGDRCNYVLIDILEKTGTNNSSRESYMRLISVENALEYMKTLYKVFVKDEDARKGFRKLLDIILSTSEGATLFHCFVGKDRTGVSAAIILTILGVSKDDIIADYLITNEMRRETSEKEFEHMRQKGYTKVQIDGYAVSVLADKNYLECTYREAEKQYGSFINFIKNGIGVTEEEIAKMKEMYLEKA